MAEFVKASAPEEIDDDPKPHIGTFRLVSMVEQIAPRSSRLAAKSASNSG